jgi:hypothetical protein
VGCKPSTLPQRPPLLLPLLLSVLFHSDKENAISTEADHVFAERRTEDYHRLPANSALLHSPLPVLSAAENARPTVLRGILRRIGCKLPAALIHFQY